MRLILLITFFALFSHSICANVYDSLKLKIKSFNNSDSLIFFINNIVEESERNNDIVNWICALRLKAGFTCKTDTCKIRVIESIFLDDFYQLPITCEETLLNIRTYVYLANRYEKLNNYTEAKKNYKQADSLFTPYSTLLQNYNIGYYCLRKLADIYTRLGDYEKAIQTFKRAEKQLILHQAKADHFASLYFNWGNVYDDLEEYDKLVKVYAKANNIKKLSSLYKGKLGYALVQARFRKYTSIKYLTKFDELKKTFFYNAQQAYNQLENLIPIFEERINTNPTDAYNFLNGIYSLQAEITEQFELYSKNKIIQLHYQALKAVKMHKSENPNAREIAKKHYTIGQTYLNFHQPDSAKHHFYLGLKTVLPKYNPKQNPLPSKKLFFNENGIFENLEGLAEVFTHQDSLNLALQAYECAFYVKLNLRGMYDFESSKLYLQQKAKAVNCRAIEVAYQLYQSTKNEKYIERAFKIAESSRALVLLEGIMQNQLKQQMKQQMKQKDSMYLAQQKAKFDQPINIINLQNQLQNQEVLIEYFQADSLLYVFRFEKNNALKLYKLQPNWQTLDLLLEAITSDRIKPKAYTTLAHNVYSNIVAPLEIPIGKKIIIIPDGQLNYLPFELLLSQTSIENSFKKLPYLLRDHTINYQYSATIFSKLSQQTNEAKYNEVLSIAPIFDGTENELRFSEKEVNAIAKLFSTKSLLRNSASKKNIINKISIYNILHFSTHASGGNPSNKQQAHIALHQDTLYFKEIYQHAIHANLTVLSACETNTGKYEGGEGVMSLSRAFAYAGCPSLVSTLWQANEKATHNIVVKFYQNLKAGAAKDAALQQAKLTYLKNSDDAHPFYWASLVLIGNTQALKITQSKNYWQYFWLLFLLLFIGYLFRNAASSTKLTT